MTALILVTVIFVTGFASTTTFEGFATGAVGFAPLAGEVAEADGFDGEAEV